MSARVELRAHPLSLLRLREPGDAEVDQGVFETAVPNLSLMPCGERPDNPAELLVSKKIDEVVADLSDKYDFVLIDSPPMLAVSDPSSIAARVEGVLLTFDLEGTILGAA